MIRFAVVHRAKDGLALSASTDLESGIELRDSKRFAKMLSRKARQFPVRSTMTVGRFKIYFTTESEVCFLSICESNYAAVLAFSFLDDLRKDFLAKYTRGAVEKAIRPYSFIEFDSVIQKSKQKYNNTRTLYTKIDLSAVSEELKNNPPYQVDEMELGTPGYASTNGVSHSNSSTSATKGLFAAMTSPSKPTIAPKVKMNPMTHINIMSIVLCLLCAVLNVIRLVPFVSQHFEDLEEETHWMAITFCFFLSAFANIFQCYLLAYPIQRRSLWNVFCLVSILLALYYLYDLRNLVQILFHFCSCVLMTYNVWHRAVLGKPPNYDV